MPRQLLGLVALLTCLIVVGLVRLVHQSKSQSDGTQSSMKLVPTTPSALPSPSQSTNPQPSPASTPPQATTPSTSYTPPGDWDDPSLDPSMKMKMKREPPLPYLPPEARPKKPAIQPSADEWRRLRREEKAIAY